MGKAEEVFAFVVEREPTPLNDLLNAIYDAIKAGLKAIGLADGFVTRGELRRLSKVMAEQIRNGNRQQKTTPETDQDQYSRGKPQTETEQLKEWFGYDWQNQAER